MDDLRSLGDFSSRGYLRNRAGLVNPEAVKSEEHRSFLQNLPDAFAELGGWDRLQYSDILRVHEILFADFYPWAGQDRKATAPELAITKGEIVFAHPYDIEKAVAEALRIASDARSMKSRPGAVIGYLAYAHPFLEGNGRTILVFADELAHRAGISIDWTRTSKSDFLTALTIELNTPNKGALDMYLAPFIGPAIPRIQAAERLTGLRGIGPDTTQNKESDDEG